MRKLFFAVCIALLVASCNNDDMNDENPYPDGVYPFEVSDVSHTVDFVEVTVTWDNPTDKGFKDIQVEVWQINDSVGAVMLYSSVTGEKAYLVTKFILEKNSLLYITSYSVQYLIIKSVDKFGNVSNGYKYEFQ